MNRNDSAALFLPATPIPLNLGGTITDNPATFPYGELDCQVKWHIEKWEGGEMWTATAMDISNYQDILVKYYLETSVEDSSIPTSGISEQPYGFVPYTLDELPADTPFYNVAVPRPFHLEDAFLPYSCCKSINADLESQELGLRTTTNCADGCFMEQMLMVMYSTDDTATPDIADSAIVDQRLANIRKWNIAEVVPRKLLRRAREGTLRSLDFSRQREFPQKGYLKLWFRFQGNSDDDIVEIEYVKVYGVMK